MAQKQFSVNEHRTVEIAGCAIPAQLQVNVYATCRALATRAMRNKTGRATLCHGAIVVTVQKPKGK